MRIIFSLTTILLSTYLQKRTEKLQKTMQKVNKRNIRTQLSPPLPGGIGFSPVKTRGQPSNLCKWSFFKLLPVKLLPVKQPFPFHFPGLTLID
jgi:hypothetical protein